jgi:hypothetical protein
MKQSLRVLRHGLILAAVLFVAGVSVGRAAGFDSTELVRQRVRLEDRRLKDVLTAMLEDADYAYRQVVIRRLNSDVGGELKEVLFKALKGFMAERGVANQADVEKTSFVDSVRVFAAISNDSVDVFWIRFYSQRDSSFVKTELDKKTGETVQRTRVVQLVRNYSIMGRVCNDALKEVFQDGVYKGVTVGEVLGQEFLSPINSEIVDVYGGFGNFGDRIVLDPVQRLQYFHLFSGFYDVLPKYDTLNIRDTAITETDNSSGTPKQIQKSKAVWDGLVLSKRVGLEFEEPLLDFSLLRQITVNPFGTKSFGLQVRVGNDEVGLPFWSSGTGQAFLILRNKIFEQSVFKFGLAFPFGVGETSTSTLFPARKLAGGFGFVAEGTIPSFNIPAGLNLPIGFSVQYVAPFKKNSSVVNVANGATIYYPAFIGTIYFPFVVDLSPRRHTSFVQLQVGFGWEDVEEAVAVYAGYHNPKYSPDTIKAKDSRVGDVINLRVASSRASPRVRVDYVNHEAAKFGAFMQYDHMWMLGGWIELFEGFRIETELAAPLRPAEPWEPSSFFLISPRIRIQ